MEESISYEARLNRDIKRYPYNTETVYKKGRLILKLTEKQFANKVYENIGFSITIGHGVFEYFDKKDIDWFKVTKQVKLIEEKIEL